MYYVGRGQSYGDLGLKVCLPDVRVGLAVLMCVLSNCPKLFIAQIRRAYAALRIRFALCSGYEKLEMWIVNISNIVKPTSVKLAVSLRNIATQLLLAFFYIKWSAQQNRQVHYLYLTDSVRG